MDSTEAAVASHYGRGGDLVAGMIAALRAAGHDVEALQPEALSGADEFHLGGRVATELIAESLALEPGSRLLDVGCGIGGPARTLAARTGAHVTGIDLTPDYVATATQLSRLVGLDGRTSFEVGSALDLPFAAASFDAATMLHVGMNVADKGALAAELARVVRPGGTVVVYDVMRVAEGPITYPVPWAAEEATSFVASPATYVEALTAAGLDVRRRTDRRALVLELLAEAAAAPPPVTLRHLMGEGFPTMVANLAELLRAGVLAPTEIVARSTGGSTP